MQHSETMVISRTEAEVWALVGNPQSWETWIPGVTDVRIEGGGAPSVGIGVSYIWRGKRQDATIAVFEAQRAIGVASSEKNYEFSETIVVRETLGGTSVTVTMGFEPTVWWATFLAIFMLPIKGRLLGRPLRRELEALRAALGA